MKTFFAPGDRADALVLQEEVRAVSANPIIDSLMHMVSGFLAVLNEERQILAVNETLLEFLGGTTAEDILGLRLGESVQCIHAHDMEGGCGTSEFCATCGAAVAMVAALGEDQSVTRKCAVTIQRSQEEKDLFLEVCACPLSYNEHKLLLVFIHDISSQQRWAAMERTFFHDVNNIVGGLLGTSQVMLMEEGDTPSRHTVAMHDLTLRLANEIEIQKNLSQMGVSAYEPILKAVRLERVFTEIQHLFDYHPSAMGKNLRLPRPLPDMTLETDFPLLMRILNNMILNALEASAEGEEVKVNLEQNGQSVSFCVWNRQSISQPVQKRMFQRNFSTKAESGRGLGTYSMKLFGEDFLGGRVSFSSSEAEGTTFRLTLANKH
jgi:K+-sensing histidine kinase KdpD